jgi:hypothetical protein
MSFALCDSLSELLSLSNVNQSKLQEKLELFQSARSFPVYRQQPVIFAVSSVITGHDLVRTLSDKHRLLSAFLARLPNGLF